MGVSAPKQVSDMVVRFDRDRTVFLSLGLPIRHSDFDIRTFPSNPFFESLGWDVANKAGLNEVFKPGLHQEAIIVETWYQRRIPPRRTNDLRAVKSGFRLVLGRVQSA